jgi:hypothetical protein
MSFAGRDFKSKMPSPGFRFERREGGWGGKLVRTGDGPMDRMKESRAQSPKWGQQKQTTTGTSSDDTLGVTTPKKKKTTTMFGGLFGGQADVARAALLGH